METKKYKIGRVKYTQDELTWKQDKILISLYDKLISLSQSNEDLTLMQLQKLLTKYDLLGEFFAIILKPKISFYYLMLKSRLIFKIIFQLKKGSLKQINIDAASNSLIAKIFEDFFLLNRTLIEKLTSLSDSLGLIAQTAKEKTKPSKPKSKVS